MFRKVYERILCIPDIHIPANHKDYLSFLKAVKEKYNPDFVLLGGDVVDFHSLSYHEHDPDLPNPGEEINKIRAEIRKLYDLFPSATCLFGNHDLLIKRKATTAGLPKIAVRELAEILNAPTSWNWVHELKLDTPKGKVYFTHGKTSSINKLSQNMSCSAVQFHYHSKYYVSYWASPIGLFFDANFGCLVDKDHPAMAYGEKSIGKPVLGCGLIKNGRAIPVPMLLSPGGRWSRKL